MLGFPGRRRRLLFAGAAAAAAARFHLLMRGKARKKKKLPCLISTIYNLRFVLIPDLSASSHQRRRKGYICRYRNGRRMKKIAARSGNLQVN